jgi:hypothetical protein
LILVTSSARDELELELVTNVNKPSSHKHYSPEFSSFTVLLNKQCVIAVLDFRAMPMFIQFNLKEERRKSMMLLHFEVGFTLILQ